MTEGPWLEEIVLVLGVLALAAFAAWLGFRHAAKVLEVRRERERTLRELLARMESPERAVDFLGSGPGRALLGEPRPGERTRSALLALAALAFVAGAAGGTLLLVASRTIDPALAGERETTFAWGALLCALALASLLIAAAVRVTAPPAVPGLGDGAGGDGQP